MVFSIFLAGVVLPLLSMSFSCVYSQCMRNVGLGMECLCSFLSLLRMIMIIYSFLVPALMCRDTVPVGGG